jgi:ParB family chromosome partitioning protein
MADARRVSPLIKPTLLFLKFSRAGAPRSQIMKLDFLSLDKLHRSRSNMRFVKKLPDVADILPSIRARGVLVPIVVRPEPDDTGSPGFGVVAGDRRFAAARIVAGEVRAAGGDPEPMPCAIIEEGDDAAALEASMIENFSRLAPDEVSHWESFTRLVKEGRGIGEIATTFCLPELAVKRSLALGNLLPRIRTLYRAGDIDATTARHLTLASKSQQKAWLALLDDDNAHVPTGHHLKAWLFGGQSISTEHALFDVGQAGIPIVADLFGDGGYFADANAFWTAQNAAIEQRRAACLDAGWADVVVVPPTEHFASWEYEKTPKRRGGRVYIDVRASGEVIIHEGYVSRREAAKAARGGEDGSTRPVRPEMTSTMQTYCDLHRQAAVRATLIDHPAVALRLMVAHAIAGSPLWTIRVEPQACRSDAIRESIETASAETVFDRHRREMLSLLGLDPDTPTVRQSTDDPETLVFVLLRLLALSDGDVMRVLTTVMGETLAAGSPAIDAVGIALAVDMADWWQAEPAFFDLIRDREVLVAMLGDIGGRTIADANAREKTRTIKGVIADHLEGGNGRTKVERWVPRWLAFPATAYSPRGGVGTVAASELVARAQAELTVSAFQPDVSARDIPLAA